MLRFLKLALQSSDMPKDLRTRTYTEIISPKGNDWIGKFLYGRAVWTLIFFNEIFYIQMRGWNVYR
jgi:hypothetical protein